MQVGSSQVRGIDTSVAEEEETSLDDVWPLSADAAHEEERNTSRAAIPAAEEEDDAESDDMARRRAHAR